MSPIDDGDSDGGDVTVHQEDESNPSLSPLNLPAVVSHRGSPSVNDARPASEYEIARILVQRLLSPGSARRLKDEAEESGAPSTVVAEVCEFLYNLNVVVGADDTQAAESHALSMFTRLKPVSREWLLDSVAPEHQLVRLQRKREVVRLRREIEHIQAGNTLVDGAATDSGRSTPFTGARGSGASLTTTVPVAVGLLGFGAGIVMTAASLGGLVPALGVIVGLVHTIVFGGWTLAITSTRFQPSEVTAVLEKITELTRALLRIKPASDSPDGKHQHEEHDS